MTRTRPLYRQTLLVFVLALLTPLARGQDSLSITDVVGRVLAQYPSIERAQQMVRSAEARRGQMESGLLPLVNIDATYERIGPVPTLEFPGLGEFQLYPENNYDAHVGGGYTVYDFGRTRSTVDRASADVQSARDQVTLSKTDLAFETISSFYTILLLRRSVQVADEELSVLNDHLTVVRAKVETGSATILDSLNVVVRVASSRQVRAELTNRLEKEESHLRKLMGLKEGAPLVLRGVFEPKPIPADTDSLMRLALLGRPELKLAHDAVKAAELQESVARSGNLPSLLVGGMVGAKNGYIPNLDVIKANWAVGVEIRVPVFDGFRTSNATEEARAGVAASEARQNELLRQVRLDVTAALSDLRTARTRIEISEAEVGQAVAAMGIARAKFESGTATNVDVLDAQTAEAAAKLRRLQALYAYVLSRYALERAVGGQLY